MGKNEIRSLFLIPLLCMVLNACGITKITAVQSDINSTAYNLFRSAAAHGDVLTEIKGVPVGWDHEQFENMVFSTMAGLHIGYPATFSSYKSDGNFSNTRLVMYFNPPSNINASSVCEKHDDVVYTVDPTPGTPLLIVAGLCRDLQSFIWSKVYAEMPASLADPEFKDIIKTVTRNIVPSISDKDNGRGCETNDC